MSAYKKIRVQLKNKEILMQALRTLGFKPVEHEKPVQLEGYEGKMRNDTAEIVVLRREIDAIFTNQSNDLGFKWNPVDKFYDMICSDYDEALKLPQRVKQAYAAIAIEGALQQKKFAIEHVTPYEELRKRNQRKQLKIRASRIV